MVYTQTNNQTKEGQEQQGDIGTHGNKGYSNEQTDNQEDLVSCSFILEPLQDIRYSSGGPVYQQNETEYAQKRKEACSAPVINYHIQK